MHSLAVAMRRGLIYELATLNLILSRRVYESKARIKSQRDPNPKLSSELPVPPYAKVAEDLQGL